MELTCKQSGCFIHQWELRDSGDAFPKNKKCHICGTLYAYETGKLEKYDPEIHDDKTADKEASGLLYTNEELARNMGRAQGLAIKKQED